MVYKAKENGDTLTYKGKHVDIWVGHDDETGAFVCDIVYHNTDVGIMGIHETGFAHLKDILTPKQLELLMERYAQAYAQGYEKAIEDIEDAKNNK